MNKILPYQKKNKKNAQKYVEVEFCNQENMDKFKNEITNADLYNKLDLDINTDSNYNYEIFSKLLRVNIFRKKI